jgi:hypothetical protein
MDEASPFDGNVLENFESNADSRMANKLSAIFPRVKYRLQKRIASVKLNTYNDIARAYQILKIAADKVTCLK